VAKLWRKISFRRIVIQPSEACVDGEGALMMPRVIRVTIESVRWRGTAVGALGAMGR